MAATTHSTARDAGRRRGDTFAAVMTHERFPGIDTEDYPPAATKELGALSDEEDRLIGTLQVADPSTPEGVLALARGLLLRDFDSYGASENWSGMARTLCRAMLSRDPFIGRLDAANERREAELEAQRQRVAARPPVHLPAPEPYRDRRTPQQKIDGARRIMAISEDMIREAEVELAASVAVAS